MEPVRIINQNAESLENLSSNIQQVIKRINQQTSMSSELLQEIQTVVSSIQPLLNTTISKQIKQVNQIYSNLPNLNLRQIQSIYAHIESLSEQLRQIPNYSNLLNKLTNESQDIRVADRFLKNFKPSMSFDDFREFSDEVIAISDYNIKHCPKPKQETQYCYEEQILQSIEKLNDSSTPSKIKEILFEQVITFIIQLLFRIILLITFDNIDFDLGKGIIEKLVELYNSLIQ